MDNEMNTVKIIVCINFFLIMKFIESSREQTEQETAFCLSFLCLIYGINFF